MQNLQATSHAHFHCSNDMLYLHNCCLLGSDAIWTGKCIPSFWMKLLPYPFRNMYRSFGRICFLILQEYVPKFRGCILPPPSATWGKQVSSQRRHIYASLKIITSKPHDTDILKAQFSHRRNYLCMCREVIYVFIAFVYYIVVFFFPFFLLFLSFRFFLVFFPT